MKEGAAPRGMVWRRRTLRWTYSLLGGAVGLQASPLSVGAGQPRGGYAHVAELGAARMGACIGLSAGEGDGVIRYAAVVQLLERKICQNHADIVYNQPKSLPYATENPFA